MTHEAVAMGTEVEVHVAVTVVVVLRSRFSLSPFRLWPRLDEDQTHVAVMVAATAVIDTVTVLVT